MTKSIRTGDNFSALIPERSGFHLKLHSIRSSVRATVGLDRNRNGRLDVRVAIDRTTTGQAIDTLSRSNLRSGLYLIRIAPTQQGETRDRLILATGRRAGFGRNGRNFAQRVLQMTNAFRQQNNLKPLRWNDRLAAAAQQHSQNMAIQDFFAHQDLNGAAAQARGSASGYLGSIGENIAAGQRTPRAVVQAWINSPPHRANLLDPRYRDIGIGFFDNPADRGLVNYRYYWTQNFGIPMG